MKILLIRKQYNVLGGAERYLESLIAKLVDRRMEVHLLCIEWAGNRPLDLRVHTLNSERPFHFWENIVFANQASEFIQKHRFDIVFSLERTPVQDIYRAGDGLHRVWVERKREYGDPSDRFAASLNPMHLTTLALEKKTLDPEHTGYIVANSLMVKKEILERTSFPAGRVEVIPNGVDIEKFSPVDETRRDQIRKKFDLPADKFIFVLVGSGFFRKGVHYAIEYVRALKRKDVLLWVVGRGTLPASADRTFVRHSPKVTSISEAYRAADAFILPTLYDPFSNAALEALASGLPVITTPYNGLADYLVQDEEGWIWKDLNNADEMVQRSQRLFDPPLFESMKVLARAKAEKFTLDHNADATLAFIQNVARAKHGAGPATVKTP